MASLVGQLERYAEAKTGRARTTGLRPYDDDEDASTTIAVVFRGAGHYEALARCDEE